MSEVNVPLLRKAVEWAEAEAAKPEGGAWYQGSYVFHVGYWMSDHDGTYESYEEKINYLEDIGVSKDCGTAFCIAGWVAYELYDNMNYNAAYEMARDALGLNTEQCHSLFHYANTIEDVRRIAEEIAGGKL